MNRDVLAALRQAVYYQLKAWEAMRTAEARFGQDFSDERLRNLAANFASPDAALSPSNLSDEMIQESFGYEAEDEADDSQPFVDDVVDDDGLQPT